ncbi:signal peptide peptidase SppA [Sphingomonas cannabina]|uniref:signal peptide peptidase SppA n=1 Tax=Sphingomonas cannabina TaxID=2899123 RepID=UPI001F1E85B5|nr:signal peptide peptidase SppA [Sphingomonas cannabina]UIJ45954.1 signal peptide peptidase SppA [Sphingomonas cannabina]
MKLVRGAWKLLVGIKDALVLILMLLFFGGLFAVLSARPNTAIRDGALVVALDGRLSEQPEEVDPLASFGGGVAKETRLRDVVRALDAARTDGRVKAVVLDLDRFAGGYPAAVAEVASAVGRVRASGKPVLAYATAYMDSSYLIAANASEIWVDPMGGAMFMGPGGSQLYYKGLIDKLGVNVHVYRVGQFKSAVEPYTLTGQSAPARAANEALYGAIFSQWRENVAKARPKAKIADYLTQPDKVMLAANGDLAKSNLAAGVVDKLGDRLAFGKRVAEIAGSDGGKPAGSFRTIRLADWIAANPAPAGGDAVGVITVAGEIVDGKAGPGTAGGETVSKLLLDGLAKKNLKALVVRIDSPGGSALASERIRQAVLQAKAQGLPVVVSMGGLAASGGYWVATAGDAIFAEPNTITGSIGIFAVLPTFENALGKIGVTADGVATTPLSGQPDVFKGTTPQLDAVLQAGVENGYRRFIARVSEARKLSPERVNEIGQGRVWDGGTAHQLKLVDRFGTLDDAVAEAARRAKLDPAKVHAVFLEKEPKWTAKIAAALFGSGDDDDDANAPSGDAVARIAAERRAIFAQAIADARRLARGPSVQALCLECTAYAPSNARQGDLKLADLLFAKLFQ